MYEIFAKLLKERGLTTYKVCKDTKIANTTISAWKCGKSQLKMDKLQILADYLSVDINYLMGRNSWSSQEYDTNTQQSNVKEAKDTNNYSYFQEIIKEKGLNINRIAKETGIPASTLYSWKQGASNNLRIDNIVTLSKYLKCSVDELLGIKVFSKDYRENKENDCIKPEVDTDIYDIEIGKVQNEAISLKNDCANYERLSYIFYMLSELGRTELIDYAEFLLIKNK